MNRPIFNLGVEILSESFVCSTFALLEDKKEMFYHFNFFEKNRIMRTNSPKELVESGILDHLSFHADGMIHVKTKKFHSHPKRIQITKTSTSILNMDRYGMFPLLIDSFKALSEYQKRSITETESIKNHFWQLDAYEPFSIVLFIMRSLDAYHGKRINLGGMDILCPPDGKQINMWLDNLGYRKWISTKSPLVMHLFNGWYLYAVVSPYVIAEHKFSDIHNSSLNTRVYSVLPPMDLGMTFHDKKDPNKALISHEIT